MIAGLGMDMVRIDRVWALLQRKGDRALARLFTPAEAERCRASRHPPESFAARFAAKEAFARHRLGIGGAWTEVEVVASPAGAPTLRLAGLAARLAEERGVVRIHLTLTHSDDTAAAVVILES